MIAKEYTEFLKVTCLDWKYVLKEDRFKDIYPTTSSPKKLINLVYDKSTKHT